MNLFIIILQEEDTSTYDCEIDLDELLDVDLDSERRSFISVS